MKKLVLTLLAAVPLLWAAEPAAAQEDQAPQMYYIYQEFVRPAMVSQYEAAGLEFVETLAATPGVEVSYTALSGPEVGYLYVIPVDGFAGIDQLGRDWEAAMGAMGEEGARVMAESDAAVERRSTFLLTLRPDLSYKMETSAISAERPFRHYSWWYAIPGKEDELEGVAREFVELYKSNGVETGWLVYQAAMGPDMPMYLVVENAVDEASYHAREAEIHETLGDDYGTLMAKAMATARRLEISHSHVRPDLSFPSTGMRVSRD